MFEPQLQSSLGTLTQNNKVNRNWNNGFLAFGKILKIHHKRNTADVRMFNSNDIIVSSASQEGIHSCRIGVSIAGIDEEFQKPYGQIVPLQKGMIVLVAFLRNTSQKPVIISVFHNITEDIGEINYNNILTSTYPLENPIEMFRYTSISRIQDFITIDGIGNLEVASHSKSFLVSTNKNIDEDTYDYEDLSIKDKSTQKTISVPENKSSPHKLLAVFRDSYQDDQTNWLRIFIDALKTSFRITKIKKSSNTLSKFEVDSEGSIVMRRQTDSYQNNSGSSYAEIKVQPTGDIIIQSTVGAKTMIKITSSGLEIETKGTSKISSDVDINITSPTIQVQSSTIQIDGNMDLNGQLNITGQGYLNGKQIAKSGDSTTAPATII